VEVGSFGEHLRREREMRGISLDEIVATTKIGRRLLVALEEEQFEMLPGGIFNKSYVRAYAKCVGMNEDEAVAEYLEAAKEAPPDTKVIAHQHAFHGDPRPERSGFPVVPVLVLLVVAAGALGGWKLYQQHQRSREQANAVAPAEGPTTPVSAAAGTSASTPTATEPAAAVPLATSTPAAQNQPSPEPPAKVNEAAAPVTNTPAVTTTTAEGPFEVTIKAKDRAWVSVKSDGIYVVRGIVKPPDVKTIHANSQVVFFTGNAGALEVTFNGKAIPLSTGENQEQTLVFTTKGPLPQAGAQ
jgi:cytoskeleton protein RodZ